MKWMKESSSKDIGGLEEGTGTTSIFPRLVESSRGRLIFAII